MPKGTGESHKQLKWHMAKFKWQVVQDVKNRQLSVHLKFAVRPLNPLLLQRLEGTPHAARTG